MKDLRPSVFKESGRSYADKRLWVQIILFLIVFIVIYLLEAIIPSLVAMPFMREAMKEHGYLDEIGKFSFSSSFRLSEDIMAKPKVMIVSLICTVFGTLASIIYCRTIEMRHVRSMGAKKKGLFRNYFFGLAIGIVLMTAITMLTVVTKANSIALCNSINYRLILLYLLGFFIQGMSEEFIFRGYLMTTVGGSHHSAVAVGISSFAFGMAHIANPGMNPLAMFNLILFGVFAGYFVILTDNIWGACAMHSVWNFLQGNFYGISVSGSAETESVFRCTQESSHGFLTGGKFGIEGSIFTTFVLAAALTVVFIRIRRSPVYSEAEDKPITVKYDTED